MRLRLLSYNIRFGGQGRESLISEVIGAHNPHLVIFQEATDTRVVEEIAKQSGMTQWGARREHSLAFASRIPLAEYEWHQPVGSHHPFIHVDLDPVPLRIFGVHLHARFSRWDEARRVREVRGLLEDIDPYRRGFHLLMGDFNALAPDDLVEHRRMPWWIRGLIWVSGRKIQRDAIRVLLEDGYVDGFRMLHPRADGHTLPTPSPHVRLDYIFLPDPFADCLRRCEVVREPKVADHASDHYPLLATLEV